MTAAKSAIGRILYATLTATLLMGGVSTSQAQSEIMPKSSAEFSAAMEEYDRAWNYSDLDFKKYLFIEGASSGFGQYNPRADSTFEDGEGLSVYAEPVAYAFAENAGTFEYKLTASYKLLNISGQILAEQSSFAEFKGSGRSKQRELSASLTFQFSGLPAGDYALEATFTDDIGGSSSSFTLPFAVAAAE